jgi:uncharacterized alkaline shock family protein YloU
VNPALSERIAGAVLAQPGVAGLHAGPFGVVASYLPGRRVDGVRIAEDGSAVELAVTLELGQPIPAVAQRLRAAVRDVAGDVRVDMTIVDLV